MLKEREDKISDMSSQQPTTQPIPPSGTPVDTPQGILYMKLCLYVSLVPDVLNTLLITSKRYSS